MMSKKATKITGWILTIVLALLFAMSASMKLSQSEAAVAQATAAGIDTGVYLIIGIVELIALILFIVPRTGVLGALLLIAYMGGAIVTHLLHQQSIVMAVVIQSLVWITAAIRFPELRQRLFGSARTAR